MKIKARQAVQGEIEFPCAVVRLVNAPHRGEQQRDGVLRHGVGRIGRHVHHVHLAKGRPHVHIVVSGGPQGDQLHAVGVQLIDHRGVHRIIHKHAHGVAALGQAHGVGVQLSLQKTELHPMLSAAALKRGLIVFLRVVKGDLDHPFPLPCRSDSFRMLSPGGGARNSIRTRQ